ncbi:hypothetical protein SAMD00019534_023260 [Acytostelium subglobosum LB1]|uniref:hypothetical protein n=1 Tax=Acytostelium subglobosum LB1 TaxID=1410327 RepID=UPI000644B5BE|nr:hypothetical protein SAMD00019534_023260 [Acytostelium subglobosum LB1]GAM19151.1 hypothetical protein SAMD00019534_023260 [Acytostelium subglobosum LB1]|eukprot:XP_012757078.1 hypothetical protein SAMD00019534_023260 [Acytostelium subglobosum LB1]
MEPSSMVACYDGSKSIYVLGKDMIRNFRQLQHQSSDLIRIDIDTLEATKVGQSAFYNYEQPVALHYFNEQIFAVISNNPHLWTINPVYGTSSQSFKLDRRITGRSSCHDGKGRLFFKEDESMCELNLNTGIIQHYPDAYNLPMLDTILYFKSHNRILVNGKYIVNGVGNNYGSYLVSIPK